ncbi:unnamed protein product [Rotaria sordida]|uniref:Uncharacterized protein n=2 Tax=Rotaria sordida TaxID=392033 RepID=A0A815HC53_9BILA|nr:unnamed protein product [Rotaria sordida]
MFILLLSTPIRSSARRQRTTTTATTTTTTTRSQGFEVIDLVTPKKSPTIHCQPNYIPRTIHFFNQQRLSILPKFPTTDNTTNIHLLLANVPMAQLSSEELVRRQTGQYKPLFPISNYDPSVTSLIVNNYYTYFGPILERFKVDVAILDYNYGLLKNYLKLYCSARLRILSTDKLSEDPLYLSDTEFPQLFEFFLQMDVDLFYMKTCSFRDAQPRSITEGIFCLNMPDCLYTMSRCGDCNLCQQSNDINYRQQAPVLFNRHERHRFVNGYESILNCPATCDTKNYIYVLTCVCGQFEFISETKFALDVRLRGHRFIGNNLIRKFLVGENNLKHIQLTQEQSTPLHKENMLLYQHSMQCSAAIQMFLNRNEDYWRFVPLPNEQANQDNARYQNMRATTATTATTTTTRTNIRPNQTIEKYLHNIRKPPQGYKFSKRQIEQQIEFFEKNMIKNPFYEQIDIYHAAIIAVLPPNTSDLFRQIVHSLFVTHTEAKLNVLGHVFDRTGYMNVRYGIWCANLVRHSN